MELITTAPIISAQCQYCWYRHETKDCPRLKNDVILGNIRALKVQHKFSGAKGRLCAFCASNSHAQKTCPKKFDDAKKNLLWQKNAAEPAFEWIKEIGFGPGCLLTGMARERSYRAMDKAEQLVVIEDFTPIVARWFFNELMYGKNRNWYQVNAISGTAERIKQIYLPYHETYSPKPTAKKVQIITRSTDAEIEALKKYFPCFSSKILNYPDAASFYAAGNKLDGSVSARVP